MYQNVIEFPRAAIKTDLRPRTTLELYWRDSQNRANVMTTADRDMIRRQMESLRKRGIMAEVSDQHGARCGSVRAITSADGTLIFTAALEGESWGED